MLSDKEIAEIEARVHKMPSYRYNADVAALLSNSAELHAKIERLQAELNAAHSIIAKHGKYASDGDGRCWHSYCGSCEEYEAVKAENDALKRAFEKDCRACRYRHYNPDCEHWESEGWLGKCSHWTFDYDHYCDHDHYKEGGDGK